MAEASALALAGKVGAKVAGGAGISYLINKALGRIPTKGDLHFRLHQKLPDVEKILYFVNEQPKPSDPVLAGVVENMRDAIQEAEFALDSLEHLDFKSGVKHPSNMSVSSVVSTVSKKLHVVSSIKAVKNLRNALYKLDEALDSAKKSLPLMFTFGRENSQDSASRWETARELTTTVFGRLKEKDEVVEWLGVQTQDHTDKLSVCAIVGDGGMGKTTLAQFVCQDKMVQGYFGDRIIWVHVSKLFDPKVLFERILESFYQHKPSADALDTLQNLSKQLLTKRFLLVLDDAWEDKDNQRWEQFLGPIRNSAPVGGRILLTTRMRSVADAVKCQMSSDTYKHLELPGLDQENTVKLFNHHAFGDLSPSDYFELRLIGEQIAKKVKGCPLIAKTIGLHLRGNTDHAEWISILNHDIHSIDEIATKIREVLKVSYKNLNYEVQVCFRYCSIFPPHYKFKKEELVEMWVSSGLILQIKDDISRENIARKHFNVLSENSFFSLVPRELNVDPSEDYYILHDWMYELACCVSTAECSKLNAAACSTGISRAVRHLYIEGINAEIIYIISKSKHLRTLIIANEGNSIQQDLADDLKKSIKGRTRLRLLKLCANGWFSMNDVIAELDHLRCIYLSATEEPNLSKLFKFCHLEVLHILKIDKENESSSISPNLPHLQKLHLPKSTLSRIHHIGSLTTLQELNGFSVKIMDGQKITELKDLKKLQKAVVLDVQNVTACSEASATELDKKSDLKVLSLEWCADQASSDISILNNLVPDSNLKHLVISGYNGTQPPLWMKSKYLINLVYLKIDGCMEWGELPRFGHLQTLKHLLLKNLPKLKHIASSCYSSGPHGCRDISPDALPPHLITFVVKDCLCLSELPDLPCSLRHLDIARVGMPNLPTLCDHRESVSMVESELSILNIESCDILVSLKGCFLQEKHCRALTVLSLVRCYLLKSLPGADVFQRMSKLEKVKIIECGGLSSLGGLDSLSYLKVLRIEKCTSLTTASSSKLPPVSNKGSNLKFEMLEIDDHLLLVSSPLRNLCLTKGLVIDRSKMAELPAEWMLQNKSHLEHVEVSNAERLDSLPNMHEFRALRSLLLLNTPLLQSLPFMPPNLWVLVIRGCCNELHEKFGRGGSEQAKISYIYRCDIFKET
uniref:Uncharacterized protein n=1 Tax=Leersia perrieri TaxID=77586 RepID=A0A0D9XZS3_9ORYZ